MKQFVLNLSNSYKRQPDLINVSLLVILSFLVFYNSLGNYYLEADDLNPIVHTKRNFIEIFISNVTGGNIGGDYRPIEVLSHQFDTYFYGSENPFGRHLTNLIIHIFNAILVYLLTCSLTKNKSIGLFAGLFFAVHVIHGNSNSPPVAWISGRVDPFLTFFYLLTVILFLQVLLNGSRIIYLISFATFVLALMSKEMAVTLPLVILLYMLLFPSLQKDERIFKLFFKIFLASGILLIILGIIFNPSFLASILSSDGKLEQSTLGRIYFSQSIAIAGGGILTLIAVIMIVVSKISRRAYSFLLSVGYSIPYFFILFIYLITRFILLGGLGGYYESASGGNLIFQFGLDAFLRDIFGLAGLIWPVTADFVFNIFTLQVEQKFVFYALAVIISVVLLLILYRLITTQSKILTFSYLWIFLTLIPFHNALIVNGYYTTRYLYLPSVGLCIFISILLYKLMQTKNVLGRSSTVIILAFILLTIFFSSLYIIHNNKELGKSGEVIERFVSDLKRYQSKISDTTVINFISFPISLISTNVIATFPYNGSNEIKHSVLNFVHSPKDRFFRKLRFRLNNILNFSDNAKGYNRQYYYNFILFMHNVEEGKININFIDEKNFTIDKLNVLNYSIVTNETPFMDKHENETYGAAERHSVLESFISKGEIKVTNNAIIKVLELDKMRNLAKLRVELKDPINKSIKNNLFFLYEGGHLQLLGEFYGEK